MAGRQHKNHDMTVLLEALLKDSAYKLSQFKPEHIIGLEAAISLKETAKKLTPYVTCLVRGNAMQKLKASRQRAGELLAAATRAVEIAIEDSEAAALAYIDQMAPRTH
jgi:hypothetical protein